MEKEARDPLLLHQFLAGLPDGITRKLKASGEVKTLEAAMAHAKLLMSIDSQSVALLEEKSSEVQLLTEQVALLTEQVAALSTHQQGIGNRKVEDSFVVSVSALHYTNINSLLT